MSVSPTVVDLFSGCGGFGLGAEQAGFRVAVAVDIDKTLQAAYRLNFPKVKAVNDDIADMDARRWKFLLGGTQPDAVIGGPPCQGFSRIGRRDREDPRNSLIGHFYRNVALLAPRFFVMENVEGLLDPDNRPALDAAIATLPERYKILGPVVISAADFGAPTTRRRVIVVGYDCERMPEMTMADVIATASPRVTVKDAISDLPSPSGELGRVRTFSWSEYPDSRDQLSAYAAIMRKAAPTGLGWPEALENLAVGKTSGHSRTEHSEDVIKRFKATAQGEVESISRYPRLHWERLCPTLRAGTGSDKGSFQAMRPIHPADARVITVREAARLQGFPDWFTFSDTKWHSFRMIGNSVSPMVARQIMLNVKAKLGTMSSQAPVRGVI